MFELSTVPPLFFSRALTPCLTNVIQLRPVIMRLLFAVFAAVTTLPFFAATRPALQPFSGLRPVFEANAGQAAGSVLFLARDARGTLEITREGANIWLTRKTRGAEPKTATVALRFPGANWGRVRGENPLASYTTFLTGNAPARRADHYGQVRIAEIYPGIDLVFHTRRGMAEFDFELRPGADAARARFSPCRWRA